MIIASPKTNRLDAIHAVHLNNIRLLRNLLSMLSVSASSLFAVIMWTSRPTSLSTPVQAGTVEWVKGR